MLRSQRDRKQEAQDVEARADEPFDESDGKLDAFQPIRMRPAADEVVAALADALRGGLFSVGDRLPRERDLALQMGVSRTVLREATGVLRRAGVLSARRGAAGGTFVEGLANLPSVLASINVERSSDVRSILEVRRPLEITASVLFCQHATEEQLQHLERLVDALEPLLDKPDEFLHTDEQFHLAVAEYSGNPILADYVRATLNRLLITMEEFPVGHVEFHAAIRNQRKTLDALRSRKPKRVVRAMEEHLEALEEHFLGERLRLP